MDPDKRLNRHAIMSPLSGDHPSVIAVSRPGLGVELLLRTISRIAVPESDRMTKDGMTCKVERTENGEEFQADRARLLECHFGGK